jgi:predicted transcriptional regulator
MNGKFKSKIIHELKNDEILRGLLGMSAAEIEIYFVLIDNQMSVEDISELVGMDKSSVYKCIKNLYRKKLVIRRKASNSSSRYVFNSVSPAQFKRLIEKKLDYWLNIIECVGYHELQE